MNPYRLPALDETNSYGCCVCKKRTLHVETFQHPSGCGCVYVCTECICKTYSASGWASNPNDLKLKFINGNDLQLVEKDFCPECGSDEYNGTETCCLACSVKAAQELGLR